MAQAEAFSTGSAGVGERGSRRRMIYVIFFIAILLPISFSLGSLRLTPLRLFLVLALIPFAIQIMAGKAGKFRLADALMFLFGSWIMIAAFKVHGSGGMSFAGITVVELLGGYVVGRALVRSALHYEQFFKLYFIVLLFLAPLAMVELMTGRMVLKEVLGGLMEFGRNGEWRLGMARTQVAFSNSILWGLFCSLAIGNLFYIYGSSFRNGGPRALFALAMTYTALSAGPFLAGLLQVLLILWDKLTKGRWVLLTVLIVVFKAVIDSISNRGLFLIFIEEFTFSAGTAWTRIHIWRYGTDEVWRHPIFGIGLNDWERPGWLTHSVDNFWLLTTMRHGVPAIVFMGGAIALIVLAVLRAKITDPKIKRMRVGYLVTMVGLFMTLSTVHVWEQMSVMVMFYIGIGAWFANPENTVSIVDTTEPKTQVREPVSRYSRRAPKPSARQRQSNDDRVYSGISARDRKHP